MSFGCGLVVRLYVLHSSFTHRPSPNPVVSEKQEAIKYDPRVLKNVKIELLGFFCPRCREKRAWPGFSAINWQQHCRKIWVKSASDLPSCVHLGSLNLGNWAICEKSLIAQF